MYVGTIPRYFATIIQQAKSEKTGTDLDIAFGNDKSRSVRYSTPYSSLVAEACTRSTNVYKNEIASKFSPMGSEQCGIFLLISYRTWH